MKCDILVCGVGGQGVLSLASILSQAALHEGLNVKQSEVHGMAQRGGAVVAHVRISDSGVSSDLIPRGRADWIVGLEPVESLRWVPYLGLGGRVLSSVHPVKNIDDYPDLEALEAKLKSYAGTVLVDSVELARKAGNPHAENVVMAGAASCFLPWSGASFERALRDRFGSKGKALMESVEQAFLLGRGAVEGDIGP